MKTAGIRHGFTDKQQLPRSKGQPWEHMALLYSVLAADSQRTFESTPVTDQATRSRQAVCYSLTPEGACVLICFLHPC